MERPCYCSPALEAVGAGAFCGPQHASTAACPAPIAMMPTSVSQKLGISSEGNQSDRGCEGLVSARQDQQCASGSCPLCRGKLSLTQVHGKEFFEPAGLRPKARRASEDDSGMPEVDTASSTKLQHLVCTLNSFREWAPPGFISESHSPSRQSLHPYLDPCSS